MTIRFYDLCLFCQFYRRYFLLRLTTLWTCRRAIETVYVCRCRRNRPQAKRRCDAALLKVASRRQSPLAGHWLNASFAIYATLSKIEFSRSVDQRINPYHFLFRSFPLFLEDNSCAELTSIHHGTGRKRRSKRF